MGKPIARVAAAFKASRLNSLEMLSLERGKSIPVLKAMLRLAPERLNAESSGARAAWLGGAGGPKRISISSSGYTRAFSSSWPGESEGCLAGGVSGLGKSSSSP